MEFKCQSRKDRSRLVSDNYSYHYDTNNMCNKQQEWNWGRKKEHLEVPMNIVKELQKIRNEYHMFLLIHRVQSGTLNREE